jgi:leucyl aminopeptidase
MKLNAVAGPLSSASAQTLILFATQDDKKLGLDVKGAGCDRAAELVVRAHKDGRFKGAAKETVFFRACDADGFENVLVVGLGKKNKVTEESLRVASAVAAKILAREKTKTATVCLQSVRRLTKTADGAGSAMAEGTLLGAYKYTELKSRKKEDEGKEKDGEFTDLGFSLADKAALKKFQAGLNAGTILAEATNFARDLGNAPGNYLTPTVLAQRAQLAAKGLPIKFKAFDKKQIEALHMGCLLGVNRGSAEEPRFIVMEYNGGKKSDKPFVLVGKGLTFDSGGISIKPSAGMEEMKFDMCGGAAVIAAIVAAAKLKLKVNLVTIVPSTENMPGDAACKPGDVLVAMNGKTVEVNNTDAEGRLILADALAYACKNYEPAAIVDAATLTGACVVALGNVFTGVFCKDEKFFQKIRKAADATGERIWQLPLVDEYVDDMKGTYADLSNMGGAKGGGSSQGAAFLSQFVEDGITWAHFDIAGTAWHTGNRLPYHPDKGASGAIVRLFTHLAQLK